jgi:hypothetical protein
MTHFRTKGKWPAHVTKADGNYLQNLAAKLFQDANKIVWIQLDDYKYPRTALYLPKNSAKWHFAKPTTTNSVVTMLLSKPTSASLPPTTGHEFALTYFAIPKPVFAVSKENHPQINRHHYIHFRHPTSPTTASTRTFLDHCLLPGINTNTFCG